MISAKTMGPRYIYELYLVRDRNTLFRVKINVHTHTQNSEMCEAHTVSFFGFPPVPLYIARNKSSGNSQK